MNIVPITLKCVKRLVSQHHRHHKPPLGGLFAIGLEDGGVVVGGVIVGRPVSRMLDDGFTVEATRLVVVEGHPNGCSMLYSAAARASKALGYKRIVTYILESEPGTSLRATGWKFDGKTAGGTWSRPSRGREDKHPIVPKQRWCLSLS